MLRRVRELAGRAECCCTMWMYTCGEFIFDLDDMALNGCDGCKRYAGLEKQASVLVYYIQKMNQT